MKSNSKIKCDVTKCVHNCRGKSCQLDSIKVTCGCGDNCTCCGDYSDKND